MSEYLSQDLRAALASADTGPGRGVRRTVRAGDQTFTVLRHWDRGFALAEADHPRLRGRVDVFEGDRHVFQALVINSREEAGEHHFELKYTNPAIDEAPLVDFVRDQPAEKDPLAEG